VVGGIDLLSLLWGEDWRLAGRDRGESRFVGEVRGGVGGVLGGWVLLHRLLCA
jgi:hypothetical protein